MIVTTAQGAVDIDYSGSQMPVIQNLGPGTLYVGSSASNLVSNGLKLVPNSAYEYPRTLVEGPGKVFIQASGGNCDVRIQNVG